MKEPSRLRTGKAQSPVAGRGASKRHQCGRSRERKEKGAGGVWDNQEGTDLGPERPCQGGVLFLGTVRAAAVIQAVTRPDLCFEEELYKLPSFLPALAGSGN